MPENEEDCFCADGEQISAEIAAVISETNPDAEARTRELLQRLNSPEAIAAEEAELNETLREAAEQERLFRARSRANAHGKVYR